MGSEERRCGIRVVLNEAEETKEYQRGIVDRVRGIGGKSIELVTEGAKVSS